MTTQLYIEAPTNLVKPSVFLAGGITGCPDWQQEIRELIGDSMVIINPRRADFPMDDPSAAEVQIRWEHEHLRVADKILFWFPAATLCPITLYELGAWTMTNKPIAVGIEPGYVREQDVRIQTRLTRPEVPILSTLWALADAIIYV
jgi:hypothetical protein